jgi:phosphoadenosine phosphosulfate reductase
MGFHRFKTAPPHMVRAANEMGLDPKVLTGGKIRRSEDSILEMVDGTNSCVDGISREGMLGDGVPWESFIELLNILGDVRKDPDTNGVTVEPNHWQMKRKALEVFPDGTLVVRARDEGGLNERVRDLLSVIKRAIGCIGCSICVGRCPTGALRVSKESGRIGLDAELCIHCSACMGPCPAEVFVEDPFDI